MRRMLVTVVFALVLFALPSTASAHVQNFYYGPNHAWTYGTNPGHNQIAICDRDNDFRTFYVEVTTEVGGLYFPEDKYGGSCKYVNFFQKIVSVRLCETGGGTTCGPLYAVY